MHRHRPTPVQVVRRMIVASFVVEFLALPALDRFHPHIRDWFGERLGEPTDVQERSWPRIASGEHLLITAPTGSGKTLTAFLWAIDAFATGSTEPGVTRVLYISPLKALNNDIRRNLLAPIAELRDRFATRGDAFPSLRVQTRSGDTDQSERQRMLRRPPELLITTPESLMLLLTTVRGRHALGTIECVILDEIHAIADNRRGAALMACLERLVEVAGEFQRIALSATVRPLEAVAEYVGGRDEHGRRRPVGVIESNATKNIAFRVRFPEEARMAADNGDPIWAPLSDSFRDIIDANRSTLFFTNSRRMAEKITLKLNEESAAPVAWAHHGSLAREIRTEVEARLKQGELKAIVATSSLEMGIDIGELDEVVLIQSPPSIAASLQRIGRAGHRVGETSRGTLFPSHAHDFLEAAVIAGAVAERDIEPLKPLTRPLDVLAQLLVSATASETWEVDRLYRVLARSAPFAELAREHFDLVVEMLAGRYAGTRVRDLRPRLAYDRIAGTVSARKGAVFALYTSGGTIPDRGYFSLRHADTGASIGELDEEFVWEASVGDTFTLGTQNWRVQRITHNDVLVQTAPSNATAPPFWRAETFNRSHHFSARIGAFLGHANELLQQRREDEFTEQLTTGLAFDEVAAEELTGFLARQREVTECDLPHSDHILVEHILSAPGGYQGPDREQQVVLHTFWGGRVNRPYALALEAALSERLPGVPDIHADNNAIAIQVKEMIDPGELLSLVTPANFELLLRASLESSGFFGARFRECAGRALLLTRRNFRHRMPLWVSRQQAKKLMSAVKPLSDFPILLETWRTCLNDEFDMAAATEIVARIHAGEVDWSVATVNVPSPFAANLAFGQVNRYMYADDTPEHEAASGASSLSDELIRQAVFDAALRPTIDAEVVAEFEARAQRTKPGYVPSGEAELAEWAKERVAIPVAEWFEDTPVPEQVKRVVLADGRAWLVHREITLGEAPLRQAAEMLQFYGPRSTGELAALLPLDGAEALVEALLADDTLVAGRLTAERDETVVCDAENLETLIRFQRAARRPAFEPRPASMLAPFLARRHELCGALGEGEEAVLDAADRLRGYAAPVAFWSTEAWRPRIHGGIADVDACAADGLCWRGVGSETVAPGFHGDELLLAEDTRAGDDEHTQVTALFRDPRARYTFHQLLDDSGADSATFNAAFWQAVWAGRIASDGLSPLIAGLARRFALEEPSARGSAENEDRSVHASAYDEGRSRSPGRAALRRAGMRSRMRARATAIGWPGTWYQVQRSEPSDNALDRLDAARERARALLDRYGVLTREQANREGGAFAWRRVFPALRLMELGGEVVAGLFFAGLSGPQFALPAALRHLERLQMEGATFWINALDPVSPSGLGLAEQGYPQRRGSNHLGYLDGKLAIVSETNARRLQIHLEPDDPGLDTLLPNLDALARHRRRLAIETVNDTPTRLSPYLPALSRHLTAVSDHRGVYFQPKH
ncbi:MAG: DEAD/DEAH box helicase [Gammaproteobacteria bacterium]|nr:DEAD/DEAH box helicase [Gammaproteobacteria bacterium]